MKKFFAVVSSVMMMLMTCGAQTQINPASQIRWPAITGVVNPSAPTWPCTTSNYGQPYTNTVTGQLFTCAASGWQSAGSGAVGAGTTGQVAQFAADGTAVQGATVSGDASLAVGGALTLSTVNTNVGTCGDATHVSQVTLNAKGLTTACSPVPIAAGGSSVGPVGSVQVVGSTPGSFAAAQTVAIPVTNGFYNTDLYATGAGNNGLLNLEAGSCSTGNCTAQFPGTSNSTESGLPTVSNIHVMDFRKSSYGDLYLNPAVGGGAGHNTHGSDFSGAREIIANWDQPTMGAGSYPGQGQSVFTMRNSFASPGFNFGTDTGTPGPLWSSQKAIDIVQDIYTQGIGQGIGFMQNKYAEGDSAILYGYNTTDGGFKDGAGEGSTGIGLHTDQHSLWFHGTVNASSPGTQLLQATYTPGAQSRPTTSTGGIMLDIASIPYTGHVTGPAVALSGITAWATPVDVAVTPSTAWGNANAPIPAPINTIVPQTDTVSFTVTGGTNSAGYTTGIACLDGAQHVEQVTVTAVGAISGGVQSVTFIHSHPDSQAGTSLWQGGPCGTFYMPTVVQNNLLWEVAYPVVGATDSSHIVGQFSTGGAVRVPIPNFWDANSANVRLENLQVSGTTVTADFYTANASKIFDGMGAAVISNSTNTSYNGTVTNVKLTNNNQSLTWTQSGASGTSATAYISLTPVYFAFNLFSGAQVTQPATSAGIPLEPNNVPWGAGSRVDNVFDPSYRGYAISSGQIINSPDSAQQNGIGNIAIGASGNGVSGQYKFFSATNSNASTMYKGDGGILDAPLWMYFNGVGSSFIKTAAAPIDGKPFFDLGCLIASQGGCLSATNDYKVIGVAGNDGQLNYTASTHEWYLNNLRTPRVRGNILSTGDGRYINGGLSGGAPVALTAASGVSNNASAALGTYGTFGNETTLDASATMASKAYYAGLIYGGALPPGTAIVGNFGTTGSTTYTYVCTSVTQFGESLPGGTGTTVTGNATLSATNFNGIQCLPGYGSQSIDVYRVAAVGSYGSGRICAGVPNQYGLSTNQLACQDIGQAAGAALPTTDTSGKVQSPLGVFNAATVGGSAVCTTATGCGSGLISSLTTTGTSGPATLTSGVLNIPQYAPAHPTLANGRATLVAGTATVSTTSAGTSSVYQLTNCGVGGTQGMLSVGTVTAGTSFVVNSSQAADTSTVCWSIQ